MLLFYPATVQCVQLHFCMVWPLVPIFFFTISRSPWGCLPYKCSNGENPLEDAFLRESNTFANKEFHYFPILSTTFFLIPFKVLLNHSTNPSVWRWHTDMLRWIMLNHWHERNCLISQNFFRNTSMEKHVQQQFCCHLRRHISEKVYFLILGGIVKDYQYVLVPPGGLWQWPNQTPSKTFKRDLGVQTVFVQFQHLPWPLVYLLFLALGKFFLTPKP